MGELLRGHPRCFSILTRPVALVGIDRNPAFQDPEFGLSSAVLQDETSSEMIVAEVTTTDRRRTRYQVKSKDDISKTRQGYKIETTGGETVRFSEEEVESISVVEE
jgi:hypothetical protein